MPITDVPPKSNDVPEWTEEEWAAVMADDAWTNVDKSDVMERAAEILGYSLSAIQVHPIDQNQQIQVYESLIHRLLGYTMSVAAVNQMSLDPLLSVGMASLDDLEAGRITRHGSADALDEHLKNLSEGDE